MNSPPRQAHARLPSGAEESDGDGDGEGDDTMRAEHGHATRTGQEDEDDGDGEERYDDGEGDLPDVAELERQLEAQALGEL